MNNIYFPEDRISFNDVFFVCFMIERTARALRQTNQYVVEHVGRDGLACQLSIAETSHCLNPDQVLHDWIAEYKLDRGTFDVSKIDPQFTDKVPPISRWGRFMLVWLNQSRHRMGIMWRAYWMSTHHRYAAWLIITILEFISNLVISILAPIIMVLFKSF